MAHNMLQLAQRNFQTCQRLEQAFPEDFAVSAAMFHIQQAVEKEMIALLLMRGKMPEFTHNIAKLATACLRSGIHLPDSVLDIADTLTVWEWSVRYDPFIDTTGNKYAKAKNAYMDLRERIEWIPAVGRKISASMEKDISCAEEPCEEPQNDELER